jgi:hypothetical protein
MNDPITHFLIVLSVCVGIFLIMLPIRMFRRAVERRAWRKRMDGVDGLPAEAWADFGYKSEHYPDTHYSWRERMDGAGGLPASSWADLRPPPPNRG